MTDMANLNQIIDFIATTAEAVIFIIYIRTALNREYSSVTVNIAEILIVISVFNLSSFYIKALGKPFILTAVILFLMSLLLYKGKMYHKISLIVIYFILIFCCDIIVLIFISYIYKADIDYIVMNNRLYLFGALTSKTLLYLAVTLIDRIIIKKYRKNLRRYVFLMLLVNLGSVYGMYTILRYASIVPYEYVDHLMVSSSTVGLFIINIIIISIINKMQKLADSDLTSHILEQQIISQNTYLKVILENSETNKAIIHDIKNQITLIRASINMGRYEDVMKYIDKLDIFTYSDIRVFSTGNYFIDALLSDKYAACEAKNIKAGFSADVAPETKIEMVDICSILFNLIDNAIEACEKLPYSDRMINLDMILTDTSFKVLITNPSNEKGFLNAEKMTTDKKDKENHGQGIKSVRKRLEKYNGTLLLTYSEGMFNAYVLI